MSQENVEIVRQAHDAFERGDLRGAVAVLSPSVTVQQAASLPETGRYEGIAGMSRAFEAWTGGFEDLVLRAQQFIDAGGDLVVVRVTASARGSASGAPVAAEFWFVYSVEDTKITHLKIVGSRRDAFEAVGLSE